MDNFIKDLSKPYVLPEGQILRFYKPNAEHYISDGSNQTFLDKNWAEGDDIIAALSVLIAAKTARLKLPKSSLKLRKHGVFWASNLINGLFFWQENHCRGSKEISRSKARKRLFFIGEVMELNLSNTVQIITVIGFAAVVVKSLIIKPLQTAIETLQKAIDKMETMLTRLAQEQKSIDKRLVAVEASEKSAHHRIDGLEARIEARVS